MLSKKLKANQGAVLFGALSFLALLAAIAAKGGSFLEHSPYDQQTRIAEAWLHGRVDLAESPPYLEIAEYQGRSYSSFPPVPALFELPFVLAGKGHGRDGTPNTAVQVFAVWLAALAVFLSIRKTTQSGKTAALYAAAFFFGTQMLYLSAEARIWHQGHCFAVAFGVFSAASVFFGQTWPLSAFGGLCLGLSAGSRPDLLFSAPYFIYVASQKRKTIPFLTGLSIPLLGLLAYNQIRFSNPLEFGHVYLPWSRQLQHGIFSTAYLARNLFHALLNPTLDGRGTSLLIAEPVLAVAMIRFFRSGLSVADKALAAASVLACWAPLLLHESNGWYQFGYRFGVDLIPVLFLMTLRKDQQEESALWEKRALPAIVAHSVLFNAYGTLWFYKK